MPKWAHIAKSEGRAYCGALASDAADELPVCPRCQKALGSELRRNDQKAAMEEQARMNEVLEDEGDKRNRDEEWEREQDYHDKHGDV